jgi:hypothetical protein
VSNAYVCVSRLLWDCARKSLGFCFRSRGKAGRDGSLKTSPSSHRNTARLTTTNTTKTTRHQTQGEIKKTGKSKTHKNEKRCYKAAVWSRGMIVWRQFQRLIASLLRRVHHRVSLGSFFVRALLKPDPLAGRTPEGLKKKKRQNCAATFRVLRSCNIFIFFLSLIMFRLLAPYQVLSS